MSHSLLVINLLISLTGQLTLATAPLVTLPTGKVEGYHKKNDDGKVYIAFEGIPYARPPVGKYRFEESKPMKPWFGTWQAKTLSKCMQYYHYTKPGDDPVSGDEDCLHVNVYTHNITNGVYKDVIVFIHGGAFMFNHGGSYGEKYLMNHDVIYVTFNYRLGPLGFLSTEDKIVPGNMGLKDQLLAIRWVRENIRYFGGNADSITVTGMSAGGASVHFLTLTPKTRDSQLFSRVISQSGTALSPWVLAEKSREKTLKLGSIVGCPAYEIKEMIKCMKYRPARQLVAAVKQFQPWLYNPFSPFGAVIDKWSDSPFLPEHPYKILKSGRVLDVPIIFSSVKDEGLYPGAEFITNNHLQELDQRWNDLIPFVLDFNNTVAADDIVSVAEKIRKFYFGTRQVSKETFSLLINMLSDRLFLGSIELGARMHAASKANSVYYYSYSYRAANSKTDARTNSKENYGVSHGDDTVMVLSTPIDVHSTESDKEMSDVLQNLWLSFAKTGKPKIDKSNWERLDDDLNLPLKFLHIKSPNDISMETADYFGHRVDFWDTLPIKENQNVVSQRDEL